MMPSFVKNTDKMKDIIKDRVKKELK